MIATDPLSLVFIFCFLLGFGFFLVAGLMGGHGHTHIGHVHVHVSGVHHAPVHVAHAPVHAAGTGTIANGQQGAQVAHFPLFSYLNPTSIALFLLGFGFVGYFFHNAINLMVSLSLILATIGGLIIAALLLMTLNRLFATSEGSTELDVVDRTGMLGKVSITIPERGLGEIIYTSPGGMHKSIPARGLNNQCLQRDQEVVVVDYRNGVAEVDTWEHFMHEESYSANSATPDEMAHLRSLLDDVSENEMEMTMRQEQRQE